MGVCAQMAAAQAPAGSLSLSGTVLNSATGEPVKRALVQVQNVQRAARGSVVTPVTMFTDSGGAFRFEQLTEGKYLLTATRPGFTPDTSNVSGLVDLTTSKDSVSIRLSPLGAISGKVVDQDAAPVFGVDVIAVTIKVVNGLRRSQPAGTTKTDDRGNYRFGNLHPGKYYIKVTGRAGGTNMYAGDTAPLTGLEDEGFRPVYADGANRLETARPVVVGPGTEANSNVVLKFEAAFRVHGTLANFVPRRTASFELLSADETSTPMRVSVNGDTGRFDIAEVVPGAYLLRVTQGDIRGEMNLTVSDADIEGLVLPLAGPATIKVATHFGNSQPTQPDNSDEPQGLEFNGRVQGGCTVSLDPTGFAPRLDAGLTAGRSSQNEASIERVYPGTYRVRTECFGSYPRSVLSGTRDLLSNPTLTLAPGEVPPPIEILALYGGGEISGTLRADLPHDVQQVYVLAIPRSGGEMAVTVAFEGGTGAGEAPAFSFSYLAPGGYTIRALANGGDVPFREPEFLQALQGGTPVEVDATSKVHVDVTEVAQ